MAGLSPCLQSPPSLKREKRGSEKKEQKTRLIGRVMPRTIWRQADPRLASNPQFSSESYLRACAEEHHYEILRKAYSIPLYVHPPYTIVSGDGQAISTDVSHHDRRPPLLNAAQSTRPIAIRDPFTNQNRSRTLATLTTGSRSRSRSRSNRWAPASSASADAGRDGEPRPATTSGAASANNDDDLRLFRWKDVIIYVNRGVEAKDQMRLLHHIYCEWFPHRAEDKDVSDGAFWAVLLRFTPPGVLRPEPGSSSLGQSPSPSPSPSPGQGEGQEQQQGLVGFVGIKGLWEWHAALVEALQDLEEEEEEGGTEEEASSSGLRPTLQHVLVLLDGDWQKEGVLLVWKEAETAKSYGCVAGSSSGVEEEDDAAGEGWQPGCVFRCSLKRAMQMTVSRDPYRTKARREWNELLGETLGDGDGDVDGS